METILYKLTSPSGKTYIGITNDFKRRVKEHKASPWPIGKAIRKYGIESFEFEFEMFDTTKEALDREAQLVTVEKIKSDKLYNVAIGGAFSNTLKDQNPMFDPEILAKHPNIWSTQNNPMNNPESKQKMIESQARKKVSIEGVIYEGVREAGRQIGQSRQMIGHRLRSFRYPDWFYVK